LFTREAGSLNVWTISYTDNIPHILFINGDLGTERFGTGALANNGDWSFASNAVYVLSMTNPDTLNRLKLGDMNLSGGTATFYIDNAEYGMGPAE
jgi:hypothetical protein